MKSLSEILIEKISHDALPQMCDETGKRVISTPMNNDELCRELNITKPELENDVEQDETDVE